MIFKIIAVNSLYCFWRIFQCSANSTVKRTVNDDYYLNYDYDIHNGSSDQYKASDSLLLPNPESVDSKYTIDVLPDVALPDDSLSDIDLKDHDFIDNIMYVYYGSRNKISNNYSPEIMIIGSVLSCAAQLLTIFCVILKKTTNSKKELKYIFLHLMGSLCFSNLLFMLSVNATKSSFKCLMVALILHYSYLLTAFWMFLYCYYVYTKVSKRGLPKNPYLYSLGYGISLFFCAVSYVMSPDSYETKKFCFMSVQKGMIINYMLPVSILLVVTTVFALNGIRKINMELSKLEFSSSAESLNALRHELDGISEKKNESVNEDIGSLRESKTCLKLLCGVQTAYDIVWFIAVVALENKTEGYSMSVVYSITSCLLNWYMFIKNKSFLPNSVYVGPLLDNVLLPPEHQKTRNENSMSRLGSSDNIPLLVNDNCTELRELRLDYISTISN